MGSRDLRWLVAGALLGVCPVWADEPVAKPVTVTLKDGGTLVGTIVAEDDAFVTLRTASGTELKLPREAIASRGEAAPEPSAASVPRAPSPITDPNESRLMFAPTGRPLGKGNGYFSDHYVIFPGFAFGLTKNVSIAGGISTIPAVDLTEQIYYLSASSGWKLGDNSAIAVGGFIAGNPSGELEANTGAALFGVATVGHSDRSLSVGLAAVAIREEVYDQDSRGYYTGSHKEWRFHDRPIVMLGGSLRIARYLSLISESWLIPGNSLSDQPFGFALRFFNGRISADVGMVLVGELLDEGFPLPWLSFSYHFGPSRSKASARSTAPVTPAWARAGRGGR